MTPTTTAKKSVQRNSRETAKNLPLMVMGLVGFTGILVSLILNEPQSIIQAQCAGLVSPNQVLQLMLQIVFF